MIKAKFHTIEKGAEYILQIKENYPEIDEIEDIIKVLDTIEILTPEQLGHHIHKLSTLSFRFAELVTKLTTKANEAYIYRKFRYVWEYQVLSGTIKDKESMAQDSIFKECEHELITRFVADHFKVKLEAVERLVSVLQSRLRQVERDWIKSNL